MRRITSSLAVAGSILSISLLTGAYRSAPHFAGWQSTIATVVTTPVDTTIVPADTVVVYDSLSEREKRFPEHAVAGLTVANGLEATLFASEPTLSNPTSIDIDDRGRVWVCDAYGYRPGTGNRKANKDKLAGDRILILEDTNGDGKADKTKIFYQGPELNAPLGILVMGNKALVSQSPNVWLFTDTDGDDKADKKEIIFRGIRGVQNDHGVHAFVFGPDGKFYFNFGNEGRQLQSGRGGRLLDRWERPFNFRQYKQGLVFRCDEDFRTIEVLGQNFRNPVELAVDSYGTVWQSDHDEAGTESVRINYVMESGNFGYVDEMKGTTWRVVRTNLEDEISRRHWHQNDPGVVPNLLNTGSGQPTGIVVYEGVTLPRPFWDQLIHCDAGANVVRSYPVQSDGAGYKANMLPIVEGKRDKWFRPSDVCVAPDGSLIVADLYDPGTGEEASNTDLNRGRIYRIAPPKTPYKVPSYDYNSPEGAVAALQNPNMSVRYKAWYALLDHRRAAEPALENLFRSPTTNPRLRARALWVLNKIEGVHRRHLEVAFREINPNLSITALRAVRQRNSDPTEYIKLLTGHRDPQVRRECALAINHNHTYEAEHVWVQLARQYKGNDRWYLEALGVGAEGQWDRLFEAWLRTQKGDPLATPAGRDIVWRARTNQAIPYLSALATDTSSSLKERLRYFRAFDFLPRGYEKSLALLKMTEGNAPEQTEISKLALWHMGREFVRDSYQGRQALQRLLNKTYGTSDYIELVSRYEPDYENDRLFRLATTRPNADIGRDAGRQLLKQADESYFWDKFYNSDDDTKTALLASIKGVGSRESLTILAKIAVDPSYPGKVRRSAARFMGGSWEGEDTVVNLLNSGRLHGDIKAAAIDGISNAFRKEIRDAADKYIEFTEASVDKKAFE
ncbi:PVC-type heme-binding CxxCH protein [Telluribacter humicola]|uniref:PVC-type heme-binding CxxCH protein n=1 Tax=Telluribacter humicola TaxID=1720261 RepID=UPI001A96F504|nr:PVC-type heme-binding CxxCH protein [Telluribacter humicola]